MSQSPSDLVLVVDDEPTVRAFAALLLERAGYATRQAGSPAEALRIMDEVRPALLVTDIVMPGMNGLALAAEWHHRFPGQPVIFMSGFSKDYEQELSGSVCLAKPFTSSEFLASVDAAVRKPSSGANPSA